MFVPFLPSMMLGDSDSTKVAQLDTAGLFAGAVDTCFDKAKGPVESGRQGECVAMQILCWPFLQFGKTKNKPLFEEWLFIAVYYIYIYSWVYHHNF